VPIDHTRIEVQEVLQ